MIPPQCDFYRATDVDDAIDLLARFADRDVSLVAGGHGLVPDMKTGAAGPDVLVDVSDVAAMAGIESDEDRLSIGALATHADVASAASVRDGAAVLAEAAGAVGDLQVRSRGTLGGNLAEADPAADPPAAVLAADATLVCRGPDGRRTVPATDFFAGDGETALGTDEVLTRVRIPRGDVAGAYVRKTHPASGYATVGVGAELAVADDGETIAAARVAVTGAADRATRLASVEDALVGRPVADVDVGSAVASAAEALDDERLRADAYASAAYRAELAEAYAERALGTAVERAGGRV